MAANEIHIGDIGTVFEVTLMDDIVVVDISSASVMQIVFEKADGTKVINTAVFTSNGVDGKMQFVTTVAGDLDQTGNWKIQGIVTLPTGKWSSDISKFKVYGNL